MIYSSKMGALISFISLMTMIGNSIAQQSATQQQFHLHWQAAQEAITARNFPKAITHLEEVRKLMPYEPTSQALMALCQAQAGQVDQAVKTLESAISHGWCDVNALLGHADFAWLRQHHHYETVLKAAKNAAEEKYTLHVGKSATKSAPLVVLLHGLGAGPRSELPYWKPLADELGFILVAPKGYTAIGVHLIGWHQRDIKDSQRLDYYDPAIALQYLEQCIAEVKAQHPKAQHVYLAGFSQGGGLALRLMQHAPDRFQGAIVVASLCQTPGPEHWKKLATMQPAIRLAVLAGKLDKLHVRHVKLVEQLEAAKVTFRAESWEQVGHEYPEDFTKRVKGIMTWMLKP